MSAESLHEAIEVGNADAVRDLLSKIVDLKSANDDLGKTPIHIAVSGMEDKPVNKTIEILRILIDAGVEVDARDDWGRTALQDILDQGDEEYLPIADALIDAGADVNIRSPACQGKLASLHISGWTKNLAMTEYMLSRGADPNARTKQAVTPLHYACISRRIFKEVIRCFLKSGADANAVDHKGHTPLVFALKDLSSFVDDEKNTLRYFMDYTDVNVLDREGKNILSFVKPFSYKVVLEHLAKLRALELTVNPSVLQSICENQEYKEYFERCLDELTRAKGEKIGRSSKVSYFNLLVDSKNKLKYYAGNEGLVEDFRKSGYVKKFPIYWVTMRKNLEKGVRRRESFDESAKVLSSVLPIFDPGHAVINDMLQC